MAEGALVNTQSLAGQDAAVDTQSGPEIVAMLLKFQSMEISKKDSEELYDRLSRTTRRDSGDLKADLLERVRRSGEEELKGPALLNKLYGLGEAEALLLRELSRANGGLRGHAINENLHGPSHAEKLQLQEIGAEDLKGQKIENALLAPPLAETRLLEEIGSEELKGQKILDNIHGPSQAETLLLSQAELGRTTRATEQNDLLMGSAADESQIMLELRLKNRNLQNPEIDNIPGMSTLPTAGGLKALPAPVPENRVALAEQRFGPNDAFGSSLLDRLDGPSAAERKILAEQEEMNGGRVGAGFMEELEGPSAAEKRILQEQTKLDGDLKGPRINDVLFGRVEPEEFLAQPENVNFITKESGEGYTVMEGDVFSGEDERAMNAVFEYWYRFGLGQEVTHQRMCNKYGVAASVLQNYLRQLTAESRQKLIDAGVRAAEKRDAARGSGPAGDFGEPGGRAASRQAAPQKSIEERTPVHPSRDPVQQPLTAADYKGTQRLKMLLLPDELQRTCIKLLNARELIKYIAEGGKMKRRQDLEQSHPRLFAAPDMVRELLGEMEQERKGEDVEGRELTFHPGIVALSYAWADDEHPDPEGKQLQALAPALEWYMSERARLKLRVKRDLSEGVAVEGRIAEAEAPATTLFALYIDFMSTHQPPYRGHEEPHYLRQRFNTGVLYAHAETMKLQAGDTKGGLGDRVWDRRGWCHVEGRLAELISRRENTLNLSSLALSKACSAHKLGTAAAFQKSGAQLAKQGDGGATAKFLRAMGPPPRAMVGPDRIEAELEEKAFARAEDRAVCVGMYQEAARVLLAVKEAMLLAGCQLSQAEVQRLPGVLNSCPALQTLEIAKSGLSAERANKVLHALSAGALPRLQRMDLSENELGDSASGTLAEALGGGQHIKAQCRPAMKPRCAVEIQGLQELVLEECAVGPGGFAALLGALAAAQPQLVALNMSLNPLGDQGMRAVRKLRRDALPALEDLRLVSCGIGGAGMLVLAEALQARLLPSIAALGPEQGCVDLARNPGLPLAESALQAVLRERAGGGAAQPHGLLRSQYSAAAEVSNLRQRVAAE